MARKKGSRNKGYFYRKGRCWCLTEGMVPLTDQNGQRLTDPKAERPARAAYQRWLRTNPTARNAATT